MLIRTWNLFHGNTHPPQRRAFLEEMVRLVVAGDPDVVCLQEVPVWALSRLGEWGGMQAVAAIARKPKLGSASLGRVVTDVHHGVLRSALTGEADAILVARRFALSDTRTAVVSTSGLRRIVHGVRLDGDLFVANFHSQGDDQFKRVLDFVAGEERVVLAGDANILAYEGLNGSGWSTPLADSIDQILVRGLEVVAPSRRLPHELDGVELSDHAPVELEAA